MKNTPKKSVKQKIYIAKDKLYVWINFSVSIIFSMLFIIFILYGQLGVDKKILLKLVFETIIFLLVVGILWRYKVKRTRLMFEKKYLWLNGSKYLYSEIERYWFGKNRKVFDGIFLKELDGSYGHIVLPPYPETHKMLYIQIKEKLFPYHFDLKNNFSEQEADEIIDNLRRSHIKNESGKEYDDFSVWFWKLAIFLWIEMIFFETFIKNKTGIERDYLLIFNGVLIVLSWMAKKYFEHLYRVK